MAADKPEVAWIHGLGRNIAAIKPFAEALLPEARCFALNLLGHGQRPIPDQISTEAFSLDYMQNLEAVGVRNPFLAGWSYGGRVALHLARHFPERIRAICLLGMNLEEKNSTRRVLNYYDPHRPREHPLSDHQRQLYAVIHSWLIETLDEPPRLTQEYLSAIGTPVLIFAGNADPIVPVEDAKALHSMLPNARLSIFEGSIHPSKEHPERDVPLGVLRSEVLGFIADVTAGTFRG